MRARPAKPLRLDLGAGQHRERGWTSVDIAADAKPDVLLDLIDPATEWPWPENSVSEVRCRHFFEHIPGRHRTLFMERLWRMLKPGRVADGAPAEGFATIVVPYYSSMRAIQDFTHEWPPVAEVSFLYWNKGWLEQNKLTHGAYATVADFEFGYGYNMDPETAARSQEVQPFWVKHYLNAAHDVSVTLVKRPAGMPVDKRFF